MEKLVKWFDLERFGAAIRVIPESPLRGIATTCLEITDRKRYEASYGFTSDIAPDRQREMAAQWSKASRALGFGSPTVLNQDDSGVAQQMRFHSMRTQYSMSELRALFPMLEASDLKDMPVADIALNVSHEVELSAEWQTFANKVLAKDAVAVWTPLKNPYEKPYADSLKVTDIDPNPERKPFALLEDNNVSRYYGLPAKLDAANYKANALIPYYASLEAATADGWEKTQLQQVDMPYVLPLWVTEAGKVIGLRDVRFAPEIMDLPPESYFKAADSGLIIGAIREAEEVAKAVSAEIVRWEAWGNDPASLEGPDHLWGSITRIVSVVEELRQHHPRVSPAVKLLADGDEASRGGSFRAKPLQALRADDMAQLVSAAGRFVPLDDAASLVLESHLVGLLERSHKLIADRATGDARDRLRNVAESVQIASEAVDQPKTKHVDTGQKIGGARKDYAKRSMVREDLDSMNDMERAALVTKKNVWPALNYVALRADGVSAQAAVCMKLLKDKLETAPVRTGRHEYLRSGSNFEADYIEAVEVVRDAVSGVRTVDDFIVAMGQLYERGRTLPNGQQSTYVSGGTPLQIQWGREVSRAIYDSSEGMLGSRFSVELRRKIGRFGPDATADQQWSSLIKPKREKTDAELEAGREKAEQERELHRPHLDKVKREGADWRSGRDIIADDLIEHFGFRAVEFGNWLPQDERQQVLNMAFDSFCDLAQALDIPPKGLSLDSELAIAFGSRGSGGKSAALAHFEPARMVINLTRLRGAGSVAHEWWHALDFHLGAKKGFASVQHARTNSVMGELTQAMKLRPAEAEEVVKMATAGANKGQDYAASWVPSVGVEGRHKVKAAMAATYEKAYATFYENAGQCIRANNNIVDRSMVEPGLIDRTYNEMIATVNEVSEGGKIPKKHRDNITNLLIFSLNNLSRSVTAEYAIAHAIPLGESFVGGAHRLPTNFAKEADKLDKSKSEPYWATTEEMFARAGAAYVHDRLEEGGTRSDYLVYGADEARYVNHPIGNPNPIGDDRKVIGEHFQRLVAEYRLKCALEKESTAGMDL
ncbi:LPD1 domain-containing protein [Pseudomonas amygdali]|uniref:LPD1 domain-containing protein n=1 Tax=Pseudomonas amygdali TaxID=47877 RepID=UPI0006E512DC|nr:LPD1 domain-containing protein [Pseudomonas amygdali]KPY55724.1 hypothetical protein ALO93_200230 [Pseudomonas amygdali pv. sesami]